MQQDVMDQARSWLAQDPDPETRAELAALIEAESVDGPGGLAERFAGMLQFGTAGLRGELGAGPARMNRVVVVRAAAGLAAWLRARAGDADRPGLVVIGYDARHKSEEFARDTAAVMVGAGLRAALLPRPLPTPVLAFAVRHLGAVAGVEVTASHNPPRDNGYKVYLGQAAPTASGVGAQIVPPVDGEIADLIAAVGDVREVPRPAEGWEVLGEEVLDAYLARAAAVPAPDTAREAQVVYTPLHGVGRDVLVAAFARAGFPPPTVVAEQAEPDPDFPTVAFPNPEEPGAMDLAFGVARAVRPDVVIANDPDADRCAVAVPAAGEPAGWRMLRGDEVGALLAAHLVAKGRVRPAGPAEATEATRSMEATEATGGSGDAEGAGAVFATTIVSSSVLSRIARAAGTGYRETLTGFKWLARVGGLRFAFEEALGYCVDPEAVRDKDGITAALLVAELVAELKRSGRTLNDLLDELALEFGLHATDQLSVRVADLALIGDAMERLRRRPPKSLAGLEVAAAEDLSEGGADLPPTDGLRYRLAGSPAGVAGARVVVRPSGTEPKLKCYLEVVVPVASAGALPEARRTAAGTLDALKSDLSEAAGLP